MQTFFQSQLDYIYFLYGLSFVFLGLVCFLIKRQSKSNLPWLWLGWFGISHGLNEWSDLANNFILNQNWFLALRLLLLSLSFICLLEFSRRYFLNCKNFSLGKWIYWPILLAFCFIFYFYGFTELNIFIRYILGVSSSLLAGLVFLHFAYSNSGYKISFSVGGISFFIYALSQMVTSLGAKSLVGLSHQELFFSYFGFPIQLVRFFLAMLIALSIWIFFQQCIYEEFSEQKIFRKQSLVYQVGAIFFVTLIFGWLITESFGKFSKEELIRNNDNIINILSGNLENLLNDGKNMANILSTSDVLVDYLENPNEDNLALTNKVLDRYATADNVSIVYLLDTKGTTVATSNRANKNSLFGKNYSFRPYFKEAIAGRYSVLFAVGVTTKEPGFYSSYPVKNSSGEIVGVAVIKMSLNEIQRYFDRYGLAFFVSPEGVLFMSGTPEYKLQLLSPVSMSEIMKIQASRQFGRAELKPIFEFKPQNDEVVGLNDNLFITKLKSINDSGWYIIFFYPAYAISLYRLLGIVITLILFVFSISFVIVVQDIKRNAALAYFASVVYLSDDAIIGKNLKGEIISWNIGAEKIYGYHKNEIVGKHISTLVPKDRLSENSDIISQSISLGLTKHFETVHLKKNGETVAVSITMSPTKDISGNIIGVSLVIRDISKEKMIEEAVKQSEKKFVDLFNNINDIVFITDLGGRFLDFNNTAVRDLGYSKQELKNMSRVDIVAAVFAPLVKERIKAVVKEGFKKFESILVSKNGLVMPVEVSSSLIYYEGKKAVLSSARDITERKLADQAIKKQMTELEKFKLVADNSSDAIVITDSNGYILYANKASEKISGFTRKETYNKNISQLWGGHMEKSFYENMWKTIKTDKNIFEGELKNRRRTGEEYYVYARLYPLLDKSGEVQFFVGIETDITKAKEIDKAKSEFISVASHQLRTPLTGIKWFSELLLKGKAGNLSDQQKDFIQQVYDSNDRMIKLVDDLLDVSHIEEVGRFRVILKPENFSEIIKELVAQQKTQAKSKGVKIVLGAGCLKNKILKLDKSKLEQAFQNLLSNAIKYSPADGKITIDCKEQEGRFICFIKDEGIGIPEHQQHRVFEKFFRADNVITVGSGTGLGLYIAKFIIEGHDGKIWFESKENKGTTFYVSLPIKK